MELDNCDIDTPVPQFSNKELLDDIWIENEGHSSDGGLDQYGYESFEDEPDDESTTSISNRISPFTTFDINHLENVQNWQIDDPDLREAIIWLIWKIEHGVSDTAYANRPNVDNIYEEPTKKQMSLYQIKKAVKNLSGLSPEKIPCCINVCEAFYGNEDFCPHCHEATHETVTLASGTLRRPRKYLFYFSPIPRLLIEWADKELATEMKTYTSLT